MRSGSDEGVKSPAPRHDRDDPSRRAAARKKKVTAMPLPPISPPLLAWYDQNRRSLPWRDAPTPYGVWVSEIMLQQTRVAAVLPYYLRWMEALPTVEALADADGETLMKLWQGLGYYSRARNLQKAARVIVEERSGRFPDTYEALLTLPGVGDYTAGAVASIAFNRPVPAVDGNALRVAARLTGIGENILEPRVRSQFRTLIAEVLPHDRPGAFNQAVMDLGAMVCLPGGAPLCGQCPLEDLCQACRLGLQASLPVRRKKAGRRVEELTVFVLLRDGKTALRQRADQGLLAGLWEFPHVPGALDEAAAGGVLADWGLTPMDWKKKIAAKHLFTHVEWRMTGYLLTVRGEGPALTWADRGDLDRLTVPSAFGKLLAEALEELDPPRQHDITDIT